MKMSTSISDITSIVSQLKLDDSLLFLNHVLNVSRGWTSDSELENRFENQNRPPVLPHVVHFIAKHLLLSASDLGTKTLSWDELEQLTAMYIDLEDPISGDPNWKTANPDQFFARALAQQLPAQERNLMQKYGLALGLFRDVGIVNCPDPYDLRDEIESEIEMPIETFMSMGQTLLAQKVAKHNGHECMGTFTSMRLADAFVQGIEFCVPEVWMPFLDRVACTRDQFRQIAAKDVYKPSDEQYEPFSFNPLLLHPIIKLGNDRFLTVDPELFVDRATFGLFYDLFAKYKTRFTEPFGFAFEAFAGQLLRSQVDENMLWSASQWEASSNAKRKKHENSATGFFKVLMLLCSSNAKAFDPR